MKVLSHRGCWHTPQEKNTRVALARSFALGFGTETDVRDDRGELVISHDVPQGTEMRLGDCLSILGRRALPLAINIKADGLADMLARTMAHHRVANWFAFDMSVPDMRSHLLAGNPVFTRLSEVERLPVWLDRASGVWLDGFETEWYGAGVIEDLLRRGKRVCVVSPELHGRDPRNAWNGLLALRKEENLMLCTDQPEQAARFFETAQALAA